MSFFLTEAPGNRVAMTSGCKRGCPRSVIQSSPSQTPTRGASFVTAQLEVTPKAILEENSHETVPGIMEKATETLTQVSVQTSYVPMVDLEEGAELRFVPTKLINGVKYAKIDKEDVMQEIEFWQNAILCSVLGANPPFEVIPGYLNRIWANYDIERVIQIRRGVFLVRFGNLQDKLTVEKKGIYYFDAKPLLFPNLDMKYWGLESLSKIESILGIPIKSNRYIKERSMIKYTRLMIEMSLEGPFPDYIEFFNDNEVLVRQQLKKSQRMEKGQAKQNSKAQSQINKHSPPSQKKYQQNSSLLSYMLPPIRQIISRPWKWRIHQVLNKRPLWEEFLSMDSIQDDVKSSLHNNKVGMIGLLETKVKVQKVKRVAAKTLSGWKWHHNFTPSIKGHELIHCHATQISTNKRFYITFVYGLNQEQQRHQLWTDLQDIS
ncbi:hypothetical protein Cgig2_002599 [Carnegiea gigantea]|uniref:DUF4283 domain-containing protein n=1 Tax=Carnegiea gigantea TaxID=171969 RepID=A0A9Q1GIJ2_9CARY|nr:hypothetical protein Cgig2_002599 [Carnegiea gigantea]